VSPAAGADAVTAVAVTRATPAWNIAAVQAPEVWALGHTGKGVVVASMDTGVDLAHPDLRRIWRGGANSWFDPHGEEAAPYDALGHGTQAMGIIVGGSGLGVAPDARWLAVKLYNADGRARMSDIHLAFQWLMDPDGDPATVDAPDIVKRHGLTGRRAGPAFEFSRHRRTSAGIAGACRRHDLALPARAQSRRQPGVRHWWIRFELSAVESRPSACDGAVFLHWWRWGKVRTAKFRMAACRRTQCRAVRWRPACLGCACLLAERFRGFGRRAGGCARAERDLGEGPDNRYGYGFARPGAFKARGRCGWLEWRDGAFCLVTWPVRVLRAS
jgi:hypothetical protein